MTAANTRGNAFIGITCQIGWPTSTRQFFNPHEAISKQPRHELSYSLEISNYLHFRDFISPSQPDGPALQPLSFITPAPTTRTAAFTTTVRSDPQGRVGSSARTRRCQHARPTKGKAHQQAEDSTTLHGPNQTPRRAWGTREGAKRESAPRNPQDAPNPRSVPSHTAAYAPRRCRLRSHVDCRHLPPHRPRLYDGSRTRHV